MRRSTVADCVGLLAHFGIDPATCDAIDVGGTKTVYLDDGFQPNPLGMLSPRLTLLDRGFNVEAVGTTTDHEVDFLDPGVVSRLEASFDLTYCFDTLEHVSDPFRFCEHLRRVTKGGGHVFAATVFAWPYHPSPEDYFRFSPTGLLECFVGPRNALAAEVEVLWYGWDSDERGVELLARRVGAGAGIVRPSESQHVDLTLGRPVERRAISTRIRRRLARALGS
jgi:SAM-dependent methyltransferase